MRRNEKDVIRLYDSLSPVMQLSTGGSMLNFGYWDNNHKDPISAQKHLCSVFAELSDLESATRILDVGSGLSAPAMFWKDSFENLSICCVNINYDQLHYACQNTRLELMNSSSTLLPFSNNSVDRVLALESSQHFKPFSSFVAESKRVLCDSGLLVLAIPVTVKDSSLSNLGILKFTWSSEHYGLDEIRKHITDGGFVISEENRIGSFVYGPLADYYIKNRNELQKRILGKYSSFVEKILFKSLQKMKKASEANVIDYVLLKCHLP